MNTVVSQRDNDTVLCTPGADPLASLHLRGSALANLAFGSLSRTAIHSHARPLAMLPSESLELDLSDPTQRQFGDYELLELIGEGGMGVVYRARQASLEREVAVKLLAAGPWASREFVERFRREAQNAARMQHPNIVAIYEVGSAEELHFFSMRLVQGPSLAGVIKQEGRLPPQRAAALLRTVAEALDYAHRLGVLHLDLKPANVLIDENGAPHVADFGLARRIEQDLAADTDEVSGTPSYMAPEQASPRLARIAPATDIWGLGAILYELVTGIPPFLGESAQETLKLVVGGSVRSPRRYAPDLPRDLEAIILKCMARDVAARYSTARMLADDLGRFIENRPVQARPLNPAQRIWRTTKRQPYIAALAALLLIAMTTAIIGISVQWRRADANAKRAAASAQQALANGAISNRRLWESRRRAALRLQADGKAFEALPGLVANIEEQEKDGLSAAVERREVGMVMNQGVTLIDRMIIPDASPLVAALSPDGSLLAIGLNDISVRWYDTATLRERGRIDLLDQPTSDGTPRTPRLLRFVDNHRLRVTLDWFDYLASPAEIDTLLVDLDRASVVLPPVTFADFTFADYSADARHALLFTRKSRGQFWQVEPWLPLSALEYQHVDQTALPWLVGNDGQHVLRFRQSISGLKIVDARHPQTQRNVEALSRKRFTAWQESSDGARVAMGDAEGHVYIVDVKAATARALPLPSGSPVTWLAFSEDDAWCAVARQGGDAFVFDVASGNTVHSGLLQHDFELRHVAISHRNKLLITSGPGDVVLWRMPPQSPNGGSSSAATRIASNPTHSTRAGLYWAGAALQVGLLATADMDGEVRLWRLPTDTVLNAQAASRPADRTPFGDERVADVAYNRIRVTAIDGRQSTAWRTLPQPITAAELVDTPASSLIAVAGRELYVFDSRTMQPRYAPAQLLGTPNNTAIRADGTLMALSFGRNRSTGFELRLQMIDLATGKLRPGGALVQGAIRQMEFSPDGKRLIVVGPLNGATEVFDSATLHRVGIYPHVPDEPVIAASFSADVSSVWLLETSLDESESDSGRLLLWDPQTNQVLEQRMLSGAKPIGVHTLGKHPLLITRDNFVLDPGGADERVGPALHDGEVTSTVAISGDQRIFAHAYGPNVQLYDTATFNAIGPPLPVNWRIPDGVVRLTFDTQGEHLLARLGNSHALIAWAVRTDERALVDLRRDADLLAPPPRARRVLRLPDAAEHAYLRSRDPGTWPPRDPPPAFAIARLVDGTAVPKRGAGAGPLQLDLTDFYTMTPFTIRSRTDTVLENTGALPMGIATLEGVDYDIRGGVELRPTVLSGGVSARETDDLQGKVTGIRSPAVPIAALHVLMVASYSIPEASEREYARIRLHYRDGSEAVLPIRTQREIPGMTGHDRPTPIGWAANDLAGIGVLPIQLFSNPRLPNPHPEKIVASLDLEASEAGWSEPVFIAITAEPVIAAANSGINPPQGSVK